MIGRGERIGVLENTLNELCDAVRHAKHFKFDDRAVAVLNEALNKAEKIL